MSRDALLFVLVGALSGCRATGSALVTAPLESSPLACAVPAPVREDVLLWTNGPDGRDTWTLDGAGNVLGQTHDVRIAARGEVWVWRQREESVPTQPCPSYDQNGNELPPSGSSDPGTGVEVRLTREGGSESIPLVEPAREDGAQDIQQQAELVASAGPYLFIRESTYAYTCGAHGNVGASARVYDIERGADVEMVDDRAGLIDPDANRSASDRARADLATDEFVALMAQGSPPSVELTAIVPSYDHDGLLQVGLQFTTDTCYACSDGAWSSYTKSSTVALPEPPVALRPWASPPPGVSAFLENHPELTIKGWSRLVSPTRGGSRSLATGDRADSRPGSRAPRTQP
jgi:hypothetical protein